MNCSDVRSLLPEHVRGGLAPADAVRVVRHLDACAECRAERDGLAHVCRMLDAAAAPEVTTDVSAVYREAALREARKVRRWRRAACFALAASLLLLLGFSLRLEVRMDRDQLVVRWGEAKVEPAPPARVRPGPAVEERLRVLDELVQALAADIDARDLAQQERIARLRKDVARALAVRAEEQEIARLSQALDQVLKEKGALP
jgi:hypothetical protein